MPEEIPARPPESAAGAEGHNGAAPEVSGGPKIASAPAPPAQAAPHPAASLPAENEAEPQKTRPILPLRDVMYGLIYPAVLGTGLVLSGQRATKEPSVVAAVTDPALWVAAAAGLFFAASFASVFEKPQETDEKGEWYGWLPFFIDSVEVVLMFACFYFLGLFEVPSVPPPVLYWAYGLLIAEIWWQCLWRKSVRLKPMRLWGMKVGVSIVLALGLIYGTQYPLSNIVVSLLVALFVVIYVFVDPRYRKLPRMVG